LIGLSLPWLWRGLWRRRKAGLWFWSACTFLLPAPLLLFSEILVHFGRWRDVRLVPHPPLLFRHSDRAGCCFHELLSRNHEPRNIRAGGGGISGTLLLFRCGSVEDSLPWRVRRLIQGRWNPMEGAIAQRAAQGSLASPISGRSDVNQTRYVVLVVVNEKLQRPFEILEQLV
jgi:hypothetical protein